MIDLSSFSLPLTQRAVGRVLAALALSISLHASAAAPQELVLLTWEDYMDADMIAAFEQAHDAEIRQVHFDSDDARDRIMLQNQGMGVDLVLVDDVSLEDYADRGWIQALQKDLLPNLSHIDSRWWQDYPEAQTHAVPYMWGTLGISYRRDLVTEPLTRWEQLFVPDASLHGRIMLLDSSRDLIGMVLKSLGYSANSEDPQALAAVEQRLKALQPHVGTYGYVNFDEKDGLVTGAIHAAMIYGGDSLAMQELNENISFVLPEEGGNVWVDFLCVSAELERAELAHQFLDFINQPQWAARNSQALYLATANASARELLPATFRENRVIYPSNADLKNSERYRLLTPRAERRRAGIISRIGD